MQILKEVNLLNEADTANDKSATITNTRASEAIIAVSGTFTGAKVKIQAKIGDTWHDLAVTSVSALTSDDEIADKGAYKVSVAGFGKIQAILTAISSGAVTVDAILYE